MGRNAKLGIGAAVVALLAVIVYLKGPKVLALGIVLIGVIGIYLLVRQGSGEEDGSTRTKAPKAKKGKARLDEILDDKAAKSGGPKTTKRAAPSTPPSGGLPTWSPGSVDAGSSSLDEVDAPSESSWDNWEKEWPQGDDADTLILDEDDPLGSLDRLDDIDPVAEVERIDAAADEDPFASLRSDIAIDDTFALDELDDFEVDLGDDEIVAPAASSGSAFSFAAAPAVINEEVSTADDIMAASEATELHVEEAGDSELARLLAKVQARLSAYE